MDKDFKPEGYNAVSAYLIADEAQQLIDQLLAVFKGIPLRSYPHSDGSIMHAEIKIDDSVVMISDASPDYPATTTLLHVYVSDADAVYNQAIEFGCQSLEAPSVRAGDPDKRGSFKDRAGNIWSVSTQQ